MSQPSKLTHQLHMATSEVGWTIITVHPDLLCYDHHFI